MRTKQSLHPAHVPANAARLNEHALREIDRFFKEHRAVIVPLMVKEILDEQIARKIV